MKSVFQNVMFYRYLRLFFLTLTGIIMKLLVMRLKVNQINRVFVVVEIICDVLQIS